MLTKVRQRATVIPQVYMKCPCCADARGFTVTYNDNASGRTPLRVEQSCRCHIDELEARRLARHELRGMA
jgi:hypothetical protein